MDQGINLNPDFVRMAEIHSVDDEHTGIESHNILGVVEKYHQSLRATFRKNSVENLSADCKLTLAVSVKAMNNTLGHEGLLPSSLVFGEFPPPFTKSEMTPSRASVDERAQLAALALGERANSWPECASEVVSDETSRQLLTM